MKLSQLIDDADLARAITEGLVKVRESGDGQRIFNYSDAAMWTPGAWDNPAVRQCRGLIVDHFGEVVARPWAKFFNHGQAEAGELDLSAPVEVTDKMDGSLGILHLDGTLRPRVASRGSFQSEQAIHATEVLRRAGDEPTLRWPKGFTPLVEIIYPANRIVCDYGDRDELVLLGGVWIETGEYVGPDEAADLTDWEGSAAETFPFVTLADAIQNLPTGTLITADTWRVEADAAELNTAERGGAPRVAAREGFIEPFAIEVDGIRLLGCTPSDREKGKGGRVLAYAKTAKAIPDHLCVITEPSSSMPALTNENGQVA